MEKAKGYRTSELVELAEKCLKSAYEYVLKDKRPMNCDDSDLIDLVLSNRYKTYKYILITALLAKSTDERINPLCLQKHADCQGMAYDARSLCHRVIVPFEMAYLDNGLGGAHEPFLSKPARVPMLSEQNHARGEKGKKILHSLCMELPKIVTSQEAYGCLCYALYKILEANRFKPKKHVFKLDPCKNSLINIMNFVKTASSQSFGGETLVLLCSALLYMQYGKKVEIKTGQVNRSDIYSKQMSDIDIYKDFDCVSCTECKDRPYRKEDVYYAADKTMNQGMTQLLFVEGVHGTPEYDFKKEIEKEYIQNGFLLKIISLEDLAFSSLCTKDIDVNDFVRYMIHTAKQNRFSKSVIDWILKCAEECNRKHFSIANAQRPL